MTDLTWISEPKLRSPRALIAFEGWGDAGEAASGSVAVALAAGEQADLIASLDPDDFFDFQQRRPLVDIGEDGLRRVRWPNTELLAVVLPDQPHDLVVVFGEEPHYRWRRFCDLIINALRTLGVQRVLTIGAFIGQVAHTVPVPLIGVAKDRSTLLRNDVLVSGYQGPTGITGVLTSRLIEQGFDTTSLWAAVPHYLANQENPQAVLALVQKASLLLGVSLEVGDLVGTSVSFLESVDAAVADSQELTEYVRRLEQAGTEIGADPGMKLVEEIERYLRSEN